MALYAFSDIWANITEIEKGNTWILVTTNRLITKKGLVMGKGIAGQAALLFPAAPKKFAHHILAHHRGRRYYGLVPPIRMVSKKKDKICFLGALQTKYWPRDPSPLELVDRSLRDLDMFSRSFKNKTIHCAMPGVGWGGLDWDVVREKCDNLPDNVIFYSKR